MSSRKRKANCSYNTRLKCKRMYREVNHCLNQAIIPLKRCDEDHTNINRSAHCYEYKTIDDMPTELLLKIFSYFSYIERKTISLVCKKWKILCSDPLLNQYYTVGPKVPLCKVKEMLHEAPYLKNFRIVMRKDLKSILYTLSKYNTSITNMKIEKCLECNVSTFVQLSKSCPSLASLAINNTIVSYGRTFKCNNKLFENLQKLTAVNSCVHNNGSYMNGVFPLTTIFLTKLFQKCKKLKYIKISLSQMQSNLLNDSFVSELCELTNYKLIGLYLDATKLTDNAIQKISLCKNLKVLKLALADQLTAKSIETLKTFTNLRTLHVTNVKRVGKLSWKSLFYQPWMGYLHSLNLSGCKRIDDNVLRVVGKNCKSLSILKLSKCRSITGDGLAEIITGCPNLTYLNIKSTRRRVAKCFNLIPLYLNKLTILACEKKHIKKHIKRRLSTLCPNLIIKI